MKNKNPESPEQQDTNYLDYIFQLYKEREIEINTNFHIHPHYKCNCSLCFIRMSEITKTKELRLDSFYDESSDESIVKSSYDDDLLGKKTQLQNLEFMSLCMKLQQPQRNGKSLCVRVMDTLFFHNKDPYLLIYNDKDGLLKLQKERMILCNLLEMRNFFISRRLHYDTELRTQTEKNYNPAFNSLEFDQKSVEIQQRIKKEVQKISIISKEFALTSFYNGGYQVMTQLEFMLLMDKRRIDPIWSQISSIQAFPMDFKGILQRNPDDEPQEQYRADDSRFQKIKYRKDMVEFEDVFDKSLEYVCQVSNQQYTTKNFQREYDSYAQSLKKISLPKYLNFMVYQIVQFLDAYHKQKIKRVRIDFVRDDFGIYHIIKCSQLKLNDVSKIQWNEMFLREILMISESYRDEINQDLQEKQRKRNIENQKQNQLLENVSNFKSQRQQYLFEAMTENTKYFQTNYFLKIDEAERELQDLDNVEKTNKIFRQINPKTKLTFTKLIQIDKKDSQFHLKSQMLENFPIDKNRFIQNLFYEPNQTSSQLSRKNSNKPKSLRKDSTCSRVFVNTPDNLSSKQYLIKTNQIPRKFKSMLMSNEKEQILQDQPDAYYAKRTIVKNKSMQINILKQKY